MISVIVATLNSERSLAQTLAALVPGAVEGLVSEAIVADGGSRDGTAVVADAAGCVFTTEHGPVGRRLKIAAARARTPHLLFVPPGVVLGAGWISEVERFIRRPSPPQNAAVFRRGAATVMTARGLWALLATALGTLPGPGQGLLIAREFYDALGGHREGTGEAETDLIRRIGKKRIITLAVAARAILD